MAKIYCHGDADGRCAAYWAWKLNELEDIEIFEVSYDVPFYYDNIKEDEEIIIVDFHLPTDIMEFLLKEVTSDITMIDHHGTTITGYKDFDMDFDYVFSRTTGAGCVLTYLYYNDLIDSGIVFSHFSDEKIGELLKKVPYWTRLIGDRDTWAWEYGDDTQFFYNAMLASNQDVTDNIEDTIFYELDENPHNEFDIHKEGTPYFNVNVTTLDMIEQGRSIEEYRTSQYSDIIEKYGYEVEFEGYKCMACNHPEGGSDIFGDLFEEYDICISYRYNGNKWTVSLYSDDNVNVGDIASERGGGGHDGASGFTCEELPEELKKSV